MTKHIVFITLITLLFISLSCSYDDSKTTSSAIQDEVSVSVAGFRGNHQEEKCDAALRPIVFCHGYLENGDAFSQQTMRFRQNGYCLENIAAYDWNTFLEYEKSLPGLDQLIDDLLEKTGAGKVDLIGHSMGGGLAYRYIKDPVNAQKVAHYASIASVSGKTIPNGIPAISITSEGDWIVGAHEIPEAENVILEDADHLQVLTSSETFSALFRFFNNGQEPISTEIQTEQSIELSGRALVIGTNTPVWGAVIEIYEVDPNTGKRLHALPVGIFRSDEQGYWGTFVGQPDAHYEFSCQDFAAHWPPIHYYMEPFIASTDKLYFRMIPQHFTPVGMVANLAPFSDRYALFAWLDLNQAVVNGRDQLVVNGLNLSGPEMADRSINTIAMFFFDANFNGQSDQAPAGGFFDRISFMRVFDLIVGTAQDQPIKFEFNGRKIVMPNWKSRTEGVSIALFN